MKNNIRKYFNSTLNPDEFEEYVHIILDKNQEQAVYREMKYFWDDSLNEDIRLPEPNKILLQKIRETILIDLRKKSQRKIKLLSYGIKIAAVFIIGLLISIFFFYKHDRQNQPIVQAMTISTPYGAKASTSLPDGSIVWLNSGSKLSYPSVFDGKRSVELAGEAFFEVVKSKNPFIVTTKYGEVEVKGTSFNVKAFADDNLFETTLVKGSVIVRNINSGNEVTLRPGQQAVTEKKGFNVQGVDTNLFTSWKDGKLIFNKEPFPSFIKKLERWYNVKIEYSDPGLTKLWYTGTIEMESISEVMIMISKAAPVTYNFNSNSRVFTIHMKKNS